MTNGEKIKEVFPNVKISSDSPSVDICVDGIMMMRVDLNWWNAEYKESMPSVTLEQEPTTKDCISRTDVLKLMQDNRHTHNGDWAMQESMDDIRALPLVTPIRPKGHWIETNDYFTGAYESIDYVECSCCHADSLEEGNYCPNCGAEMESEG